MVTRLCAHRKLYNMLLKAFAERVSHTIEEQLKALVGVSGPLLKAKLEEKMVEFGSGEELMTGDFLEALNDNEEKAVRNPDRLSSLLLSLLLRCRDDLCRLDGARLLLFHELERCLMGVLLVPGAEAVRVS